MRWWVDPFEINLVKSARANISNTDPRGRICWNGYDQGATSWKMKF